MIDKCSYDLWIEISESDERKLGHRLVLSFYQYLLVDVNVVISLLIERFTFLYLRDSPCPHFCFQDLTYR